MQIEINCKQTTKMPNAKQNTQTIRSCVIHRQNDLKSSELQSDRSKHTFDYHEYFFKFYNDPTGDECKNSILDGLSRVVAKNTIRNSSPDRQTLRAQNYNPTMQNQGICVTNIPFKFHNDPTINECEKPILAL